LAQFWDGRAVVAWSQLRVRECPDLDCPIKTTLSQGQHVCVLSNGLTVNDGYNWFFIRAQWCDNPGGIEGYVAGQGLVYYWDGTPLVEDQRHALYKRMTQWGSKYWAERGLNYAQILSYFYPNATIVRVTPPSIKFNVGDRVQVMDATAPTGLVVQPEAWVGPNPTWWAPPGSTGTIIEVTAAPPYLPRAQPQSSHGYIWWKIRWDNGVEGWSPQESHEGRIWLVKISMSGPPNDNRANAIVLSVPSTWTQSTTGATTEAGEPSMCASWGATVWFRFTAPSSGMITVDTFGSDYDTVLAAYPLGSNTQLACNDDAGGVQSQISIYLPLVLRNYP